LWHARAYTVGRLVEVLGESRKIDRSDLYEAFHFDDAAYADVLMFLSMNFGREGSQTSKARILSRDSGLSDGPDHLWSSHRCAGTMDAMCTAVALTFERRIAA
jgi:hypothetical protein